MLGVGHSVRKHRRGFAAWTAVLALLLQSLLTWSHAAAMAKTDPGTVIICTVEGPKAFVLDVDGKAYPVPAEEGVELPPACPGCLGAPVAAAVMPAQPSFGPADRPAEPPVLIARLTAPADARAGPSQPRAPPASV